MGFEWARWRDSAPWWTVGIEEEVMLLDPTDWSLAPSIETVLAALPRDLCEHVSAETHAGTVELTSAIHHTVAEAVAELQQLRGRLDEALRHQGLRAACAGTHPFAEWRDTRVAEADRYQAVQTSMRALARREPTFALHVHVGVGEPEVAVAVADRMRAHVPLLTALSANSPFWQGRDSGLASARTPVFGMFPRTGIPPRHRTYAEWVESVAMLIDSDAIPEPTFLWWDVRPQPQYGSVELRGMDAQTRLGDTAALAALVQSLVRLEAEEGYADEELLGAQEALEENHFLAARDGARAELIDPRTMARVPVRQLLAEVLEAAAPHAERLDCADELARVPDLLEDPPAQRQRAIGLERVLEALTGEFLLAAPTPVQRRFRRPSLRGSARVRST